MENRTVRAIRERRMIFNEIKKANRNKLETNINKSVETETPVRKIDFEEMFADDSVPTHSNR